MTAEERAVVAVCACEDPCRVDCAGIILRLNLENFQIKMLDTNLEN